VSTEDDEDVENDEMDDEEFKEGDEVREEW